MSDGDATMLLGCIIICILGVGSLFLMPFLLMWVWNMLAVNFNFQPIINYWVAFAGWFAVSFVVGLLRGIFAKGS